MSAELVREDDLIGTTLDHRYRVLERIGIGGMAEVYLGEQCTLGRKVAIKVLQGHWREHAVMQQRLANEARIISRLRHPNTLKLIDLGRTPDGRLYMVTEFVAGQTLEDVLTRERMNPHRCLSIARQVLGSLAEAHLAGVVHRDLKPANIMVETIGIQEVIKVLDFGTARLVFDRRLTLPQYICGTPAYMAPEQLSGGEVDHRSDFYSLGTVLYECLAGHHPFSHGTNGELHMFQLYGAPPSLSAIADVPEPLSALVMQLLEKDPRDRPQNIGEIDQTCEMLQRTLIASKPRSVSKTAIPSGPSGHTDLKLLLSAFVEEVLSTMDLNEDRTIIAVAAPPPGQLSTREAFHRWISARRVLPVTAR